MSELEIMATGVAIVMGVLTLLWGLTAGIGMIVVGIGKASRRPRRRDGTDSAAEPGIPPHHLVAIAAAVAEVIASPHRIVRVAAPAHRQTDWTSRGRGNHRMPGWPGHRRTGRDR